MKIYLLLLLSLILTTGCAEEQKTTQSSIDKKAMAEKVRTEFQHAWNGYKQFAWEHDDLKPLSKSFLDWYDEPLLMTPIDGFSTMKLMGLEKESAEAKSLILTKLNFNKNLDVQVFEINIRLLGGLLSAYQLDGDKRFLTLAKDLADRLLPAFNSPTGIPYRFVNLQTGKTSDPDNNPAEAGTLILEFGTLSKITGDPVYYEKAKNALKQIYKRRSKLNLAGTIINCESGEWINKSAHISARIDSYYEYLLKAWKMFGDEDFKEMWDTSINAINKYLPDNLDTGLWYGYVNMDEGKRTETYFGALDAFFPAVLALSGDIERAEKLQKSNYKMWMIAGIEPEVIDYKTMEIVYPGYVLRPENIESAYYLYKLTGKEKYLKMGKEYFDSIVKYCRNEVGYSHLKSVVTKEQSDDMQSFFLAETMKYSYLLFAPIETIDFKTTIFNTEAHPLKIWN